MFLGKQIKWKSLEESRRRMGTLKGLFFCVVHQKAKYFLSETLLFKISFYMTSKEGIEYML